MITRKAIKIDQGSAKYNKLDLLNSLSYTFGKVKIRTQKVKKIEYLENVRLLIFFKTKKKTKCLPI